MNLEAPKLHPDGNLEQTLIQMLHVGIGAHHGKSCCHNQQNAAGGFQFEKCPNSANHLIEVAIFVHP